MKNVTFTFRAVMLDEVSEEQIRSMATAAYVQIEDPEGGLGPLRVATSVTVNGKDLPSYDAALAETATRVGLGPAIMALRNAEIPFDLVETVGSNLGLIVLAADGTVVVTTSDVSSRQFSVEFFPDDTWEAGDEYEEVADVTAGALAAEVRRMITERST